MSTTQRRRPPTQFIGETGDDVPEVAEIVAESREAEIGAGQPIRVAGSQQAAPAGQPAQVQDETVLTVQPAQPANPAPAGQPVELSPSQKKGLAVLDAWIAAEVLTPETVKDLKDLVSGRERDMAALDLVYGDALPWEEGYPETEFPSLRAGYLAYDVVLGSIPEAKAAVRLEEVYGQSFGDGGAGSGVSILASLRVAPNGTLDLKDGGPPLSVSAFGWGLVRALKRDLSVMPDWKRAAADISEGFHDLFGKRFMDKPVDKAAILEIYYWMLDTLGIGEKLVSRPARETDVVTKPSKVIGYYQKIGPDGTPVPKQRLPDTMIMNSFFLGDLLDARRDLAKGIEQPLLDRYLGVKEQVRRINILEDPKAINTLLRPGLFPEGKWPHAGRNQLVTMQQSIINYALHPAQARRNKVIGVNGPPGTGKTTLLKDAAAALIVRRAIAMSDFIHPSHAFRVFGSGGMRSTGRAGPSLFELDPKLIGFEMMVASSNNGAVENVSTEWPDNGAIADDATTRYFPGTASRLHDRESWGLISAALGNAANRSKFRDQFWFDEDWGLRNQLALATGRSPVIVDKKTGAKRIPASFEAHRPARGRHAALERWNRARDRFLQLLDTVRKSLADLNKATTGDLDQSDPFHFHTLSPWLSAADHRQREDLFEAAVGLHRAFMEAAATEVGSNLSAAMDLLAGRFNGRKPKVVQSVLSTLFIAVPVLSTTFASVGRMLRDVEEPMIGWLFIDEAGQATPQSAVGAIKRSRNALVVGDPIQVEPVVTLNEPMIVEIGKAMGIDHEVDLAPWASVQTFADGASEVFAEYPCEGGARRVGMPLLAHRRCAEPMFSISNQIGYGGLMVNAKRPSPSAIRDACGPSRWIDVVDPVVEKWSEQEGMVVFNLLRDIVARGGKLDLYIISPFRIIESRLRDMVIQNHAGIGISFAEARELTRRIGTVHRVQGREAEGVIFVLGHQGEAFKRAREWAGGRPNIANVAVTRAKEVLYIVGNRADWSEAGYFHAVEQAMDAFTRQHGVAASDALAVPPAPIREEQAEAPVPVLEDHESIFDLDLGLSLG